MSTKLVTVPFYVCNSVTITNVASFISSVSEIKYKDTFSYQWVWAGNSSTTMYIQTSNNYSPYLAQNAGQANNGNWDTVPLNTTATTNSGTSFTAVVQQAGPSYVRFITVTTSSGSALLTAIFNAKSLG